jgi:hypothetical protein
MIAPQEIPGSPRFVVLLFVGHISGRRGKTGPSPMRMRAEPLILRVFSTTGGRGGIRTHETLAGLPVFKTGALNHSATLPWLQYQ